MGITPSKSRETLIYDEKQYYFGAIKTSGDQIKASGTGKFYSEDGSMYIGKFKKHRFNGQGTMYYSGGNIYTGNWHENSRHGEGKLYFFTGERYEGEFVLDEMHGNGKFYYNDGAYYEGEFLLGVKNGKGRYFNSEGILLYDGDFAIDMFNGKGVYYYENGNVLYEGNWKNSLAHGIGSLYMHDGKKFFHGYFFNGEPIYEIFEESVGFNSNDFGEYNYNYNFPNMNNNNFNKDSINKKSFTSKKKFFPENNNEKEDKVIIKENVLNNIDNSNDLFIRSKRVEYLKENENNSDNVIVDNVIAVKNFGDNIDQSTKPEIDIETTNFLPNHLNINNELSSGRISVPKPIDRNLLIQLNNVTLKEKVSTSNPLMAILRQDKDINKKSFTPMQIKKKNQIISVNDDKVRNNPYYNYLSVSKMENNNDKEITVDSPKKFFGFFQKNTNKTVIEPIKKPNKVNPPSIPQTINKINPLEDIVNVVSENNYDNKIDNIIKINPLETINDKSVKNPVYLLGKKN